MKLRSIIKQFFLIRADGELKVTEEVFEVRRFLNGLSLLGICDLQ
jgi:hypothetical protein